MFGKARGEGGEVEREEERGSEVWGDRRGRWGGQKGRKREGEGMREGRIGRWEEWGRVDGEKGG